MNATAFATPNRGRPGPRPEAADLDTTLTRVRSLADLLDQRFRIPGTSIRFGLDRLIGLIPLVDLVFDVAFKANMRNLRLLEREILRANAR